VRYQTAPLPDMSDCRAGDGNRTRPRSLEGFCAATTLRPQATPPIIAARGATVRPAGGAPRSGRCRPRRAATAAAKGRTRVSRAPPVERDHRAGHGAAERRRGERDEPGVLLRAPEAPERHRARRGSPHELRVLAQRVGVEVPRGERDHGDAVGRPLARARGCSPRPRRGRRSSASCRPGRDGARASR
jgi:hypothetical protein